MHYSFQIQLKTCIYPKTTWKGNIRSGGGQCLCNFLWLLRALVTTTNRCEVLAEAKSNIVQEASHQCRRPWNQSSSLLVSFICLKNRCEQFKCNGGSSGTIMLVSYQRWCIGGIQEQLAVQYVTSCANMFWKDLLLLALDEVQRPTLYYSTLSTFRSLFNTWSNFHKEFASPTSPLMPFTAHPFFHNNVICSTFLGGGKG